MTKKSHRSRSKKSAAPRGLENNSIARPRREERPQKKTITSGVRRAVYVVIDVPKKLGNRKKVITHDCGTKEALPGKDREKKGGKKKASIPNDRNGMRERESGREKGHSNGERGGKVRIHKGLKGANRSPILD